MASTYATFTPGTSTNNNKFTISVWVKRSKLTGDFQATYVSQISGGSNTGLGLFLGNDESVWYNSGTSSSTFQNTSTTAKLRDLNGWYHIVVAGDTTQSGTDKLKIWINGVQQTSFDNDGRSSFVGLSYDLGNATYANQLGRKHDSTYYLDGVLSHFHFIDGTAYQASDFGEYDANGIWKIKTDVSVTYGTNGFFILKDGNSVTDQSGNGNNFTVAGGTLTKTEDSPSNVFATMNALDNFYAGSTFSNGNNTIVTGSSNVSWNTATFGLSTGKWYWETELDAESSGGSALFGISDAPATSGTNNELGGLATTYAYLSSGNFRTNNANTLNGVSATVGDIIGIALNLDDNQISYYKNGTIIGSAQSITAPSSTSTGVYFPAWGDWLDPGTVTFKCNFGNGYFGTTAVASAGTNASGIGIFEYDVPTGYTALSTKGLNL